MMRKPARKKLWSLTRTMKMKSTLSLVWRKRRTEKVNLFRWLITIRRVLHSRRINVMTG